MNLPKTDHASSTLLLGATQQHTTSAAVTRAAIAPAAPHFLLKRAETNFPEFLGKTHKKTLSKKRKKMQSTISIWTLASEVKFLCHILKGNRVIHFQEQLSPFSL